MISAIVLAAGESKRMGQTKQLLDWEGRTILQRVLENLSRSRVDEVILVLGHEAERILQTLDTRKVKVVINKNYKEGMITSIQQGLINLNDKVEAFFIVLADQPAVGPEIFDRLISEFRRGHPPKKHCPAGLPRPERPPGFVQRKIQKRGSPHRGGCRFSAGSSRAPGRNPYGGDGYGFHSPGYRHSG